MPITPAQLAEWKEHAELQKMIWGYPQTRAYGERVLVLVAEVERLQSEVAHLNYAKAAATCTSDGRLLFYITTDGQIVPPEES